MASTNFALPIGAQGVPPIGGTGGGFGQPAGVSINPPSGQYGGVAGTHPGSTYQNSVGPRNQVRFQVQPQVTVACRPAFPLPINTRRKDYLMSINPMSEDAKKSMENKMKSYGFVGEVVVGLQQVNEILANIKGIGENSELGFARSYINTIIDDDDDNIHKIINPFGVYNNRGTHDGQAPFSPIPNSNIGNIIGVNISNYCFMRDIWGIDLRCGDALELWYIKETIKDDGGVDQDVVQIHPVAGCVEDEYGIFNEQWLRSTYGEKGPVYDAAKDSSRLHRRVRVGRVWATPMHHPFQSSTNIKNIVGHDAEFESSVPTLNRVGTNPSLVYKNIEVELTGSRCLDFI
jgi:hypothetical protein